MFYRTATFPRAMRAALCSLALISLAQMAAAEALAPPEGPVLLTVTGQIGRTNGDGVAELDLGLLREMGLIEIRTHTIWTDGELVFEGVPLDRLLSALKADGRSVLATALNDYAIEIPVEDAVEGGPILAIRMNGIDLSPRDKGPIWVVYPYDANPDYQRDVIYSRSIWQLTRLDVLP